MALFGKKNTEQNTQVNQLASSLKSKEALSEILIHSIADGIIATDVTGNIALINKAAADMTEWSIEEATKIDSRLVVKIIADEKSGELIKDIDHPFSTVIQSKTAYKQTIQLVSRNNKRVFVSLSISPVVIKDTELVGTVAVLRDVNAEHTQEQRSADFISTASHEMRTPVAAIEGYLALALNPAVSQIDPKAREYLEKAHSSTQHLGQLFQDLLTSAKAEDGRLTSHPVVTEMNGFLESLVDDLKFAAEKKGLGVEFIHGTTAEGATVSTVEGEANVGRTIAPLYYSSIDPDRMREVITNVFDNAVKYTETGKIRVGITGDTNTVQIHIADTGPGISKDDLPHLFQKFYRIDNSTTRTVGGTGLGLYICGAIVKLYNGTIWAESMVGEGSTFYINLPRLSSQQAAHLQSQEKATLKI